MVALVPVLVLVVAQRLALELVLVVVCLDP